MSRADFKYCLEVVRGCILYLDPEPDAADKINNQRLESGQAWTI